MPPTLPLAYIFQNFFDVAAAVVAVADVATAAAAAVPGNQSKTLAQHMRGRKRDDVALKSRGSQVKAEAVAPAKSMTNEMFNLRLRENQKKKRGTNEPRKWGRKKREKYPCSIFWKTGEVN